MQDRPPSCPDSLPLTASRPGWGDSPTTEGSGARGAPSPERLFEKEAHRNRDSHLFLGRMPLVGPKGGLGFARLRASLASECARCIPSAAAKPGVRLLSLASPTSAAPSALRASERPAGEEGGLRGPSFASTSFGGKAGLCFEEAPVRFPSRRSRMATLRFPCPKRSFAEVLSRESDGGGAWESNLRGLEASGPEAPAFQGGLRFPG